jgi:TatD DNase family protein
MSEFFHTRVSFDGNETRPQNYPELPEPLEVGTYDNHTHLEIADGETPLGVKEHLALMRQVNMLGAVQVGVTLESSIWSAQVASQNPMLLAAVALHPNEAPLYQSLSALDEAISQIAELARQPRVRAVGETGLDFFRTEGDQALALQLHSFEAHIEIAKDNDLALQIHDRDAHDDVVATLKRVGSPEKVVLHCFSGDLALVESAKNNGWFISFAGNITFKRNQYLRDALLAADIRQVLVETDAPFLAPEPLRGRPNAPYLVPHTLRFLAELLRVDINRLAEQINRNTENAYGSWSEGL